MKNLNKKLIPIIAIIMAVVTVAGIILAAVLPKGNTPDDGTAFNELFTKDVLENMKVDDIVSDPKWGENLADATDGYIMVDANKFEFQEKVGAGNGYSKLYYNEKSKDIEMIEHSYVTYTNEKDPKEEINKIIANIQCDISGLLGEPAKSFMLMNSARLHQRVNFAESCEFIKTPPFSWSVPHKLSNVNNYFLIYENRIFPPPENLLQNFIRA